MTPPVLNFAPAAPRAAAVAVMPALVLALAALSGTQDVHAEGLYVGGNAGYTLSSLSRGAVNQSLAETVGSGATLSVDSSTLDRSKVSWSADIGYMFSPWVGVEAAYFDLGSMQPHVVGAVSDSSSPQSDTVDVSLHVHPKGPALSLRLVLPMLDAWFVDAHLGVIQGRTTTSFRTVIDGEERAVDSPQSNTTTSLLAQVGTGYVLAAHWTLRADLLYINGLKEPALTTKFNVMQVTAGLAYTF